MIDRGIGIAGIALSIIIGALQFFQPEIPGWVTITGIGVGILMLGMSIGIVWAGQRNQRKLQIVDNALLRLHIYQDYRTPDRLEAKNIFRWYYLSHILMGKNEKGKNEEIVLPTLFVTFEPEVKITSLKVRSPDMKLPLHEVKEFNQKFAIITFSGRLKEGTLEIVVEP